MIGLNFHEPIRAIYRGAVINGRLASPVMVMLMSLVRKNEVMAPASGGRMVLRPRLAYENCDGLSIVGMVATRHDLTAL
jgi:hypothetical protein